MITKEILEMYKNGASNEEIANYLSQKGFTMITLGFDEVINGVYYRWDNDTQELVYVGDIISLAHDDAKLDAFKYRQDITPSDIDGIIHQMKNGIFVHY